MGEREEWPALDRYRILEAIGLGQYGKVFLAIDKQTEERVAIKRMKVTNEKTLKVRESNGRILDVPALIGIEIKMLRMLNEKYVVKLRDVVYSPTDIYLVFEYMEHDLCGIISKTRLTAPQIKCIMKQLLEGIHYCHLNRVIHRDIKSANLLVNSKGVLKLADFGMSLALPDCVQPNPCGVVTLWYRPPELLLGFTEYGPAVDMWSVGCVFAELLVRKSIFPGRDEYDQLSWIFKMCGTPDETTWPGVSRSKMYRKFMDEQGTKERCLRRAFNNVDPLALDLLERLLTLNPEKRITAMDALLSDYMWSDPMPCGVSELPISAEPCTEMKSRLKRNREENKTMQRKRARNDVNHVYEHRQADHSKNRVNNTYGERGNAKERVFKSKDVQQKKAARVPEMGSLGLGLQVGA